MLLIRNGLIIFRFQFNLRAKRQYFCVHFILLWNHTPNWNCLSFFSLATTDLFMSNEARHTECIMSDKWNHLACIWLVMILLLPNVPIQLANIFYFTHFSLSFSVVSSMISAQLVCVPLFDIVAWRTLWHDNSISTTIKWKWQLQLQLELEWQVYMRILFDFYSKP